MKDENGIERETCLVHLNDDVQWTTSDGVFIKGMILPIRGMVVSQHAHKYDHTTLVAMGSVRVWLNGDEEYFMDYKAPSTVYIQAELKHKIQALEDDTSVYCIHNAALRGGVHITSENSPEQ